MLIINRATIAVLCVVLLFNFTSVGTLVEGAWYYFLRIIIYIVTRPSRAFQMFGILLFIDFGDYLAPIRTYIDTPRSTPNRLLVLHYWI